MDAVAGKKNWTLYPELIKLLDGYDLGLSEAVKRFAIERFLLIDGWDGGAKKGRMLSDLQGHIDKERDLEYAGFVCALDKVQVPVGMFGD